MTKGKVSRAKWFAIGIIVAVICVLLFVPGWRLMQPVNMLAHSHDTVQDGQAPATMHAGNNKDSGTLIDKASAGEVSGEVVDVGYSQGYIDWDSLAPNISGAILECGYGSDYADQDDSTFAYNVSECERLGIPWGTYIYSYASNDDMAASEANHVLRLISGHNPTLGIWYDLEQGGLEYFYNDAANVFCPIIQNAGYSAGVYSGAYNLRSTGLEHQGWPVWAASYGSGTLNIDVDVTAWQWTDCGIWGFDTSHWYGLAAPSGNSGGSGTPAATSTSGPVYRVCTEAGWLAEMDGTVDTGGSGDDFAGIQGDPIVYIAIDMPGWYQVETEAGGWLPAVSAYDPSDLQDGCAGDGSPIIAVRCYYETPDPDSTGWLSIYYAAAPIYSGFLPTMKDTTDLSGSGDDFAGNGCEIDRFTASIAAA